MLGAFKATFDSFKTPEAFKLAWPGVESGAKDFLAAIDTYHEHLVRAAFAPAPRAPRPRPSCAPGSRAARRPRAAGSRPWRRARLRADASERSLARARARSFPPAFAQRSWLPKVVDSLSPERRVELVGAMQAKRVEIAASKLKGPDDIDLRAIKKAAKLAEKARLAAEELENEGGAAASKKVRTEGWPRGRARAALWR